MSTRAFEDGLDADADLEGDRALDVPGVSIVTSRHAGTYYCAHAFYVLARWAERTAATGVRAPGVGFLHVPADDATTGDAPPTAERHVRISIVVASALRGLREQHGDAPLKVLLTGYGPFQGVVDNPTGAFVSDLDALGRALARAAEADAAGIAPLEERGARIARVRAGPLEVGALVLDVSDHALDPARAGSLPWALERYAPDFAISMGVHRASASFRVELLPTDGGLEVSERGVRHAPGKPVTEELRELPLLARAIERGARLLRADARM